MRYMTRGTWRSTVYILKNSGWKYGWGKWFRAHTAVLFRIKNYFNPRWQSTYLIQSVWLHCVGCPQKFKEVMSPKVVADISKHSNPYVSLGVACGKWLSSPMAEQPHLPALKSHLDPVSLMPWLLQISLIKKTIVVIFYSSDFWTQVPWNVISHLGRAFLTLLCKNSGSKKQGEAAAMPMSR